MYSFFLLGFSVFLILSLVCCYYFFARLQVVVRKKEYKIFKEIASCNNKIRLQFATSNHPKPYELVHYRVYYHSIPLIDWSLVGFEYENINLSKIKKIISISSKDYQDAYSLAHGKKSVVTVEAQRVLVRLLSVDSIEWSVEFHLGDDGLAFRYHLMGQDKLQSSGFVTKEHSQFVISKENKAYLQIYQKASLVTPSYEDPYLLRQIGSNPAPWNWKSLLNPIFSRFSWNFYGGDGWAFPALFCYDNDSYLLLSESGLQSNYVASHIKTKVKTENASLGVYEIKFPEKKQAHGDGNHLPLITLPFSSPWRVSHIGKLEDIFSSTLITDLSPAVHSVFKSQKPKWVKPGVVAWDWWAYGKTGDLLRQKKYVDAASQFSWPYVLVDANWHLWKEKNPYESVRDLVQYARDQSVGIFLWYNSGGPNNHIMEGPRNILHNSLLRVKEFKKLRALGISGIKIDFFHSDKQKHIKLYRDILLDAARYSLMVNFHGSTIPRGWQREFPNLMTMEAVKGAEWFKIPLNSAPTARDHIMYAMTRNVIGPMDYTPLVLEAGLAKSNLSYAHSLALTVIFESSLQHFGDYSDQNEKGYRKLFREQSQIYEFLKDLPCGWDQSLLLSGKPNRHVVVARRKNKTWYLAGISSDTYDFHFGKKNNLALLELEKKYYLTKITQGRSPDKFNIDENICSPRDIKFKIRLTQNDGFILILKPDDQQKEEKNLA